MTYRTYRVRGLGRWCARSLMVYAAAEVTLLVYTVWYYIHVLRFGVFDPLDQTLYPVDIAALVVFVFFLVAYVTCVVLVAVWTYRAVANARAADPNPDRIGPGWAVGWYFVPIALFWMPLRAMRQTWNTTMRSPAGMNGPLPTVFTVWWGSWIASNLISNASLRLYDDTDFELIRITSILDIAGSILGIASAVALRRIIRAISARQEVRSLKEVFA